LSEVAPFGQDVQKSPEELKQSVVDLENAMLKMTDRQIELVTIHHFSPGIYMRELRIPAGVTLTGAIHKTEHLNILSKGDLSVMTEEGIKRLTASQVIKSTPGIKRAGYAHQDSVWITVHSNPDNIRDVKELWELLVVEAFDYKDKITDKKKMEIT